MKTSLPANWRRRLIADDPEMESALEQARVNADVAQEIYRLRTTSGLTQQQLARRAGISRSVLSQLEDSDYEGHSFSMLARIASALGASVKVSLFKSRAAKQYGSRGRKGLAKRPASARDSLAAPPS